MSEPESPIDTALGTRRIRVQGRSARELLVQDLRLTVVEGPDRGVTASLTGPSLLVGTGEGNDLRLRDPAVSSRHAMVRVEADGVVLEDLGSTNGTWVEEVRIGTATVQGGTRIRVGESQLALEVLPQAMVVVPSDEASFHGLIGCSPAMREVFALVEQLAASDLPVLVHGETGTGKELVARALHRGSHRSDRPLVPFDCGSLAPDLLRSDLFGHEKGAFTGATEARPGVLERAEGGTVFLDEIGEMPLDLQPHLLRALEAREVQRLGATRPTPVSFRVVAATHRDLRAEVAAGRFRSDLLYRLACVTLRLPPLRERLEDLEPLACHLLVACAARQGGVAPRLSSSAVDVLRAHSWPGNVRELRNVVETAYALRGRGDLDGALVARCLSGVGFGEASAPSGRGRTLAEQVGEAERVALEQALAACGGSRKKAAERLGISTTTLWEKMKRHGLGKE